MNNSYINNYHIYHKKTKHSSFGNNVLSVLIAGLAGGMAEIAWVSAYSYWTGISSAEVARQIVASILFSGTAHSAAPFFGVLIHLTLSLALAAAYAALVWRPFAVRYSMAHSLLLAMASLGVLWAVNFLFILPIVNPTFVNLMPYPVSFISKLLFGLCMAAAFKYTYNPTLFYPQNRRLAMSTKSI